MKKMTTRQLRRKYQAIKSGNRIHRGGISKACMDLIIKDIKEILAKQKELSTKLIGSIPDIEVITKINGLKTKLEIKAKFIKDIYNNYL